MDSLLLQWTSLIIRMYLLTSCSVFSACMGVLAFRGRLSAPSISFMCRLVRDFCWLSPPSPFLTLILWPLVIPLSIAAQQWEGSPPLPLSMKKRPPSSCWLTKSAKEIASAIRSRRITSVEITTLCLRQLEAVNPALNAVVATFAEEALVAAAAADDALQDGSAPGADSSEGALWGVPIIIKECFSVDGKPFTGGVASRRGVIGDHDCAAVRRLRECGLVVLGLANTSEGCMWFESDNPIYGRTSNPFDLRRTAGGSSGGCAAAVSARCCPIAVTSDVGGSTRIPAAFVGLYGHKPTGGAVTNNGTFPAVGNGDIQRLCQLGPTAHHAEDLMPLLRVLQSSQRGESNDVDAGRAAFDASAWSPQPTKDPSAVDLSKLRVFVLPSPVGSRFVTSTYHPDLVVAQHRAIKALEELGAQCCNDENSESGKTWLAIVRELKMGVHAFSMWSGIMDSAKPEPFLDTITQSPEAKGAAAGARGPRTAKGKNAWWLFLRAFLQTLWIRRGRNTGHERYRLEKRKDGGGDPPNEDATNIQDHAVIGDLEHTIPAAALAALESITALFPGLARTYRSQARALRERIVHDVLGAPSEEVQVKEERGDSIIVCPSLPFPAPLHTGEALLRFLDTASTSLWNAMELPAICIPMGANRDGLPVSVQVVAAPGKDHVAVAVAIALEKAGVAVSPSPYSQPAPPHPRR